LTTIRFRRTKETPAQLAADTGVNDAMERIGRRGVSFYDAANRRSTSPPPISSIAHHKGVDMGEFYKMEYDAWDEGTMDLTLEEEAAYLRLCHQMYRRGQPVPVYDRMLCSLWRCHQNKARPLLKRLIAKGKISVLEDGRVVNDRVRRELDARETVRRHRADAGHTGGTRSAEARRKPLEINDPQEAKSSRGEERRREERREKRDGADAPGLDLGIAPQPVDPEKLYFDRAIEIMDARPGEARTIAANLKKASGNDVTKARRVLEQAVGRSSAKQFLWRCINDLKKKAAEPIDDTVLMNNADDSRVLM
jgi:uncharacterized protein YdaU (DUF1376 family)